MRVQVGHVDKMGEEQFFYLEFNEDHGWFNLITERISREGRESSSTVPLHEAKGGRGYAFAVEWIRNRLAVGQ